MRSTSELTPSLQKPTSSQREDFQPHDRINVLELLYTAGLQYHQDSNSQLDNQPSLIRSSETFSIPQGQATRAQQSVKAAVTRSPYRTWSSKELKLGLFVLGCEISVGAIHHWRRMRYKGYH
ncbi:hypothetical protein TNCV_2395671 [Trichonephila clavipes]|nr:hypothetical protein TNCV_2395671 [Trichonephila clavipes]